MKGKTYMRLLALAVVIGLLLSAGASLGEGHKNDQSDWEKVRELQWRRSRGERLSETEIAYLQRAWELRRKQLERIEQMWRQKLSPTAADVRYGPHRRNLLDFWQAKSQKPAPLVVFIHGGAWHAGDKHQIDALALNRCLESGISVAAINYRFVTAKPLPAPFHDAARAIQFLRFKAKEWNIDKTRVAAYGGSAGACMSLWLAFHDDMADPESRDPVARQSTRLLCAGGYGAQTSLDPAVIRKWVGECALKHPAWPGIFGVRSLKDLEWRDMQRVLDEVSPIQHLNAADPPVFLQYAVRNSKIEPDGDYGKAVHHPMFGIKLKEAMDALRIECVLRIKGEKNTDKYEDMVDFFGKKFGIARPDEKGRTQRWSAPLWRNVSSVAERHQLACCGAMRSPAGLAAATTGDCQPRVRKSKNAATAVSTFPIAIPV